MLYFAAAPLKLYILTTYSLEIPWERKELLIWNKKHFSSFLKWLSFEVNNKTKFGRWESDFKSSRLSSLFCLINSKMQQVEIWLIWIKLIKSQVESTSCDLKMRLRSRACQFEYLSFFRDEMVITFVKKKNPERITYYLYPE